MWGLQRSLLLPPKMGEFVSGPLCSSFPFWLAHRGPELAEVNLPSQSIVTWLPDSTSHIVIAGNSFGIQPHCMLTSQKLQSIDGSATCSTQREQIHAMILCKLPNNEIAETVGCSEHAPQNTIETTTIWNYDTELYRPPNED